MQVIVWKVGDWKPGKYPDANGKVHDVRRVIFKDDAGKEYFLNLDQKQPETVAKWDPYMVAGNVLDVVVMPKGGYVNNDTTINKFQPFTVVKRV